MVNIICELPCIRFLFVKVLKKKWVLLWGATHEWPTVNFFFKKLLELPSNLNNIIHQSLESPPILGSSPLVLGSPPI